MQKLLRIFTALLCVAVLGNAAYAQTLPKGVSVITHRYDTYHSGWNNHERKLSTATVDTAHFGLLGTLPVDDQLYAQPLIVSALKVGTVWHNVVYAATVNNSVYAYDADSLHPYAPLWHVNLTHIGSRVIKNTDMTGACGGNYHDFSGNIGIVGTPVVDTVAGTLYVVSREVGIASGGFHQYLHALDMRTGAERTGSPVEILGSIAGYGDGNVNGTVYFDPQKNNQRCALLLHNGTIYICWASHCDWGPYHGWMMGYDATTLQRTMIYNTTPNGSNGGIWMSANGPTVGTDGYIYLATGNGTVGNDYNNNHTGNANDKRNRGESLLKLAPSGNTMYVADFFTPANYPVLEAYDLDYGVDGVTLIPNTDLSLSGSKEGKLYLVNDTHMGKYTAGNDSVVQILAVNTQNTNNKHVHGAPLYYKVAKMGIDSEYVYCWAESDTLRQFTFNRTLGKFDLAQNKRGTIKLDNGMPGGILSVSSNGTKFGTGVVWAYHTRTGDANQAVRPGRLDAFDARNVNHLLWSSEQKPTRDATGDLAKFNLPVVANGKLYLATFSNRLDIYGLFHPPFDTLTVRHTYLHSDTVSATGQMTIVAHIDTVYIAGATPHSDTVHNYNSGYHTFYTPTGGSTTTITTDSLHSLRIVTIQDTAYSHTIFGPVDELTITVVRPAVGTNSAGLGGNIPALTNVRLYPNPVGSDNRLNVGYTLAMLPHSLRFGLSDALGRCVFETELTPKSGENVLPISLPAPLAAGVYTAYLLIDGSNAYLGRVTKEQQ